MSPDDRRFDKFNLNHIIIKPLYLGLTINIVLPGALLFICYYLDTNNIWTDPYVSFEFGNTLFVVFAILSLANSGLALWMKSKMVKSPMIKRAETFEDDLAKSLLVKSKQIFLIISMVAVYGILYYLLTVRFREAAFFTVFSFVVFQFVRPRIGFVQGLIDKQKKLVDEGKFLRD